MTDHEYHSLQRYMKPKSIFPSLFTGLLSGFFFSAVAISAAFSDQWLLAWLGLFLAGIAVFVTVARLLHKSTLLAILLAGAIAAPTTAHAAEPDQQGGSGGGCAVAAGVVVIVVGGIAIYCLVKFCQKKFPKKKKEDSSKGEGSGGSGELPASEAASWSFSPMGSCWSWDDTDCHASDGSGGGLSLATPTTFIIDGRLELVDGVPTVVSSVRVERGHEETWTWPEFQAWTLEQGLAFTGGGGNERSYAVAGQPVPESQSSIRFDSQAHLVSVNTAGQDVRRVEVYRSATLESENWTRLLIFQQGLGTAFRIEDTTLGEQMFYRLEVTQGD